MNVAFQTPMTVTQYLAWGEAQGERRRTELINGQVVYMAPERIGHIEVKLAAALALRMAIRRAGIECHALADGATVRIDEHTAYEPDALVYCGARLPRGSLLVPNPVIIVEVLSPTTAHTDTSVRLIGYFKLPSVQHYLVVDPEAETVTHHVRSAGGTSTRVQSAGMLGLDPPGIEFDIAELFG